MVQSSGLPAVQAARASALPASSAVQAKAAPAVQAGAPAVPAPSAWVVALENSVDLFVGAGSTPYGQSISIKYTGGASGLDFEGFRAHGVAFSARPIPNSNAPEIRSEISLRS